MSKVEIVITKDTKSQPLSSDKQRKTLPRTPGGVMTIPASARKPNKWDSVMSKMAETKPRPLNVKDVKSKVFLTTKVSVIPSHPSTAHSVRDKEQEDPLLKGPLSQVKGSQKTDRHRLPKLIKDTYSSQSSTISTSSEEHHLHKHSRLTHHSSNSSTSRTVVIRSNTRSPTDPPSNKTHPSSNKGPPERVGSGKASKVVSSQEVQSLRAELTKERESRERLVHENKALRVELKTLLEQQQTATRERQKLEQELSSAEERLKEARSDWEREREHASEESEAIRRSHAAEVEGLLQLRQAELCSLQERHDATLALLQAAHTTDLNQLRASFELTQLEQEQKHDFECEELKAKHLEELDSLESHFKVELELLHHKLAHSSPSFPPPPKDTTTDVLHKEITSLSVVVELRNNEIKDLRQEVMSQRLELERLQGVDDQNQLLTQRVEDLEAQVQKTRDDKKKLIVENQTMQTSMHEAMTAKDRLAMQVDFLRYRIQETNDSPKPPS